MAKVFLHANFTSKTQSKHSSTRKICFPQEPLQKQINKQNTLFSEQSLASSASAAHNVIILFWTWYAFSTMEKLHDKRTDKAVPSAQACDPSAP